MSRCPRRCAGSTTPSAAQCCAAISMRASHALLLLLLTAIGESAAGGPPPTGLAPCVGYQVSGAGTAAVNGCYKQQAATKRLCGGSKGFMLDAKHQLYEWKGVWRLGHCGAPHVFYAASHKSALPPQSAGATIRNPGGCGGSWKARSDSTAPCPAVNRSNLPPPPTPPPPPPKPRPPPLAPPPPPMRLVFADDFSGPEVNTTRWNVLNDSRSSYCPPNVFTEKGALVLRVTKNNQTRSGSTEHFACGGGVNTAKRFYQRQGRWEVSVKLPHVADGRSYTLHSSIWLTARDSASAPSGPVTPPNISDCAQEIDVVEQYVGGRSPESTVLAHVDAFAGGPTSPSHDHCKGGWMRSGWPKTATRPAGPTTFGRTADFTSYFTTFSLDWTATWMTMSINGTVYSSYNVGYGDGKRVADLKDEMFLWLTAHPLHGGAPVSAADHFPLDYMVDWVRIYEWV